MWDGCMAPAHTELITWWLEQLAPQKIRWLKQLTPMTELKIMGTNPHNEKHWQQNVAECE